MPLDERFSRRVEKISGCSTENNRMSKAPRIPDFERLDSQKIIVNHQSGDALLHYRSDDSFREDYSKMLHVVENVLSQPPASFSLSEWRMLVETIILHRLLLIDRGLLVPEKGFAVEDMFQDPRVYRIVLAELDRRHDYNREHSIPLFASFFGLDRATAEKLAASKDAFENR